MKTLQLHRHKTDSILRRHPWIFSGAISTDTTELSDGELVTVTDSKGNFLARGHFQHATIAVRVLSFEDVQIDQDFFNKALKRATELRETLQLFTEENSICRLVHGEGDSPICILNFPP